jgi:regulator of sigma E protease
MPTGGPAGGPPGPWRGNALSGSLAITIFVVSLIAAIMLHEAGHFLTARRFGMRADRFFLGFGPTLWSTHRGETEYGVKALPLGGFVRIRGMSELDERLAPVPDASSTRPPSRPTVRTCPWASAPAPPTSAASPTGPGSGSRPSCAVAARPTETTDRIVERTRGRLPTDATPTAARAALAETIEVEVPASTELGDLGHRLRRGDEGRFFNERPAWQRAIVLAAGSAVHFLIAIVLLLVMFLLTATQLVGIAPTVSGVIEDSPAEAAGLQPGDELVAVEGQRSDDYDVLRDRIRARARPGDRAGGPARRCRGDAVGHPELAEDPQTGEEIGQVGFLPTEIYGRMPAGEAVREAFTGQVGFVTQVEQTFLAIGRVFGPDGLAGLFTQATGGAERDLEGAVSLVGAAGHRRAGSGLRCGHPAAADRVDQRLHRHLQPAAAPAARRGPPRRPRHRTRRERRAACPRPPGRLHRRPARRSRRSRSRSSSCSGSSSSPCSTSTSPSPSGSERLPPCPAPCRCCPPPPPHGGHRRPARPVRRRSRRSRSAPSRSVVTHRSPCRR